MRPAGYNLTLIHHKDSVTINNSRQSMGHNQDSMNSMHVTSQIQNNLGWQDLGKNSQHSFCYADNCITDQIPTAWSYITPGAF